MSRLGNVMRIALLQLKGSKDKAVNIAKAATKISEVMCSDKPRLIVLPECLNLPLRDNAETIPDGKTSKELSVLAKANAVFIIGGTIPELGENDAIYNTCTVWNPAGELIAKHRKMHLFDIDVKGGIRYMESDYVSAGNQFTIIEVDGHKIGIGICYDIRFEEMARIYRNAGCKMLVYPAAFSMTTGPMHWELLQRARANDNQLYVVTASPARDVTAPYVAFGHSMVVDPWAKVVKCATEAEETVVADIVVEQVRQQIPIFRHRRLDLYSTEKINEAIKEHNVMKSQRWWQLACSLKPKTFKRM